MTDRERRIFENARRIADSRERHARRLQAQQARARVIGLCGAAGRRFRRLQTVLGAAFLTSR